MYFSLSLMGPKQPHNSAARSPIMEADAFISSPEASFMPGFTSNDPRLAHIPSLLFDLSLLREKIHQVQSFVGAFISADIGTAPDAAAHAGTLINDLIAAASSILFTLQQLALCSHASSALPREHSCGRQQLAEKPAGRDVVELDAGVLLAKYTHSCHVCGKGFQRDANLRMHMRAHGDEYKTRAALAKREEGGGGSVCRKYSCPQEGCRWNAKHEKFQPLKSVACAKNHYKRSHCPKLYVCSRCGAKEFAVLSDLRTHEKHCGNPRWRCTCGTTFSRKDKLMGHVKLFAYHAPVPPVEGAACN